METMKGLKKPACDRNSLFLYQSPIPSLVLYRSSLLPS
jgi:hypothetical protein